MALNFTSVSRPHMSKDRNRFYAYPNLRITVGNNKSLLLKKKDQEKRSRKLANHISFGRNADFAHRFFPRFLQSLMNSIYLKGNEFIILVFEIGIITMTENTIPIIDGAVDVANLLIGY